MTRRVLAALLVTAIALVVVARADNPIKVKVDPKKTENKDDTALDPKNTIEDAAIKQQRLSQQFREFEGALLRLAQRLETSSKAEDREKAVILKKAIDKAMNEGVDTKFDRLVFLLKTSKAVTPDYLETIKDQNKALADDIRTILAILLTDNRDEELRRLRQHYQEMLKRLNAIIRDEKVIRALNDRDSMDKDRLAGEQNRVAKATDALARALGKGDAKDGGEKKGAGKGEAKPGANKGEAKEDTKENKVAPKDNKGAEKKPGGIKESQNKKESQGGAKGGDPKAGDNKGGAKQGQPKEGEKKPGDKSESKGRGDGKGESKGGQGSKSGQQNKPQAGQSKGGQQGGRQQPQGQSKGEQKPGNQQQQPPQNNQQQQDQLPARKKIEDAHQNENDAEKNIEKDKRTESAKDEEKAIDNLTQAKRAIEELLRQLREEEIERLLAQLQQRCERMLAMQIEVRDGTVSTQRAIDNTEDKKPTRTEVQKGLQLADREDQIVLEANKAIELLKTEGSAVAFPEVFIQIRSDMMNVSRRLRKTDTGSFTQTVEQDIIDTLKEMIEALKKAQKDQQARRQNPPPPGGQPPDDKLIDLIAELKMIRSLQIRVNNRTRAYSREYEGKEQAPVPDADLTAEQKEKAKIVLDELKDLAARQQKIYEVTEDIAKGRNK
jgi:hypothetical protein